MGKNPLRSNARRRLETSVKQTQVQVKKQRRNYCDVRIWMARMLHHLMRGLSRLHQKSMDTPQMSVLQHDR